MKIKISILVFLLSLFQWISLGDEGKGDGLLSAARADFEKGNYEKVEKALDTLIKFDESPKTKISPKAFYLWLDWGITTGKYKEVISKAKDYLSENPEDAKVRTALAEVQIIVGDYKLAKENLKKVLKRDKYNWEARYNLLDVCKILNDKRELRLQAKYATRFYQRGKADTAAALTTVAQAISDRDPQGAWQLILEAHKADKNYLNAYIVGGILAQTKYSFANAQSEFEKAIKLNPNNPWVLAGASLTGVKTHGSFNQLLNRAIEVNPNFSFGMLLKGYRHLFAEEFIEARKEIEKGLKINPSYPGLLALQAAYYDTKNYEAKRDEIIKRIHEKNPSNSGVYNLLSKCAESRYRFKEALRWARKSMEVDPTDWEGYYLSAMSLLRLGEEKEGYELLQKAFDLNQFNVRAYNTLLVLDRDFKENEYDLKTTEHFAVKIPKDDSKLFWPYLKEILEPTYEKFTKKYNIKPQGPKEYDGKILVLFMPDSDSFSARSVGLPGLHASGVCFGQVITMPSPRLTRGGYDRGFNWKCTFEHEFLHVLTLQKTDFRIPRWFTEGISVWEESETNFSFGRLFQDAHKKKLLLPIEKLEKGFTRPTYGHQVPVCYYQAGRICEYLKENFGEKSLFKLVDQFKKGKRTEDAITATTGLTIKEFNEKTMKYFDKHCEDLCDIPTFHEKYKDVMEEIKAKDQEALKSEKINKESFQPFWLRVSNYLKKTKKNDEFLKSLQLLVDQECRIHKVYHQLGLELLKKGKNAEAVEVFRKANFIDPFQLETHLKAAEAYEKLKQPKEALIAYRSILAIDPDNKDIQAKLAKSVLKLEKKGEKAK